MSGRRRKLARILDAAERGEAVPMQAGYWLAHEYHRWRRRLADRSVGLFPLVLYNTSIGTTGWVELRVSEYHVARTVGWI